MTLRPELYIIPVSVVLAVFLVFGLHAVWKPASQAWEDYDPTVLYAVSEPIRHFTARTCQERSITAFGSSLMYRAFDERGVAWKWMSWNHMERQVEEFSAQVISRFGRPPSFQTLLPILDKMPNCRKTLIFQGNVLFRHRVVGSFGDMYGTYFYTSNFHMRYFWENLWPTPIISTYHSITPKAADPFQYNDGLIRKVRPVNSIKLSNIDRNLDIIEEQIERGARVIIIDIARGNEYEEEAKDFLREYREKTRALANAVEGLEFLEFPSLAKEMYTDQRHMNAHGSDEFYKWLAPQIENLGN